MTFLLKNKVIETTHKELSIQISLNGLSFCILNKHINTIVYLKNFPTGNKKTPFQILDKLQLILKEEGLVSMKFDNVIVIYVNELSTLVPKPFFKEELLADYLKFNSKILKTDFISYDEINTIEAFNVYVPYVNINNHIYECFGCFTYKHFSTILIEKLQKIEVDKTHQSVYINVCNSHFEILSFKNNTLLIYNTFQYTTKQDFIYYLLFTIEQLSLDPEILELIFLGDVNKDDEIYEVTHKYIRNVNFGKHLNNYDYLESITNTHSNFTLINSF